MMKYVNNSQEHPIGKVEDFFYRVKFQIRGSCHYLVTTYFFIIIELRNLRADQTAAKFIDV